MRSAVRVFLCVVLVALCLQAASNLAHPSSAQAVTKPTLTYTDGLTSFANTYAVSDPENWTTDGSNASLYFEGDAYRATRRSTDTPEWLEYALPDISSVTARIFYVGSSSGEIQFSGSSDGAAWTTLTVTNDTPVNEGSGWYRANFTASSLPNGTNFIRVQIQNDSRVWAPQIGQVSLVYSGAVTTTDQLNDWSRAYSHTSDWRFDNAWSTTYFNGDASRATRTSDTPQYIVYKVPQTMWFSARIYILGSTSGKVFFTTSPDGATWTNLSVTVSTPVATGSGWSYSDYSADSAIPSGTNYVRVEFANDSSIYSPQLGNIVLGGTPPQPVTRVMPTTLSTMDVPVGIYNVEDFGAAPNTGYDETEQFQNALNAASLVGGGVVFAPAGKYLISGHLNVPVGVTLRGDWASPDSGGAGVGTILEATEGAGSSTGTAFITTHDASVVRDLSVWYPNQTSVSSVVAYPYTIAAADSTRIGPTLENLTLYNSYQGINLFLGAGTYDYNIYGTFLHQGLVEDKIGDIARLQSLYFKPEVWANSTLGTPPTVAGITAYTRANATGVTILRNDWGYEYDLYLEGFQVGMLLSSSVDGSYNGQIQHLVTANGKIGLEVDTIQTAGVEVTSSQLDTSGADGVSLYVTSNFASAQTVSVNNTELNSPTGSPVQMGGAGTLELQHCTFTSWASSSPAVAANAGTTTVETSTFAAAGSDVSFGSGAKSGIVVGNAYNGSPEVSNASTGNVLINTQSSIGTSMTPTMPSSTPSIGTFAKPSTDNLVDVTTAPYNAVPDGVTDDTVAFQNALNAVSTAGGGTVYVPAGRYNIASHLSVPAGVELRGASDGPRQYGEDPRGSLLLASEGQGSTTGTAFITLGTSSGVRGISIFYPNQAYNSVSAYPATILGSSTGDYVEDVTMPDSYVAIRMTGSGYYVNYARGIGLSVFVDITGVSGGGYIENTMNTVGDWQDMDREANAPIQTWWQQTPSFLGTGMNIDNSDNVNIFDTFSYGVGYGITVAGTSSHLRAFGLGADDTEHGVELAGSGSDNVFVNSQLTAIGPTDKYYIYSESGYSGTTQFFNFDGWAAVNGSEFNGSGTVYLEGYLDTPQASGTSTVINLYRGTLYMWGSSIVQSGTQVYLDSGATAATVNANSALGGLGVTNNLGTPNVWLNVLR